MPADYSILASVYEILGLGEFARTMTPRLFDFAQRNGWLGRQITDLGCGSGIGLGWLVKHNYVITAIDSSAEMLAVSKVTLATQGLACTWVQQDIREVNRPASADMVTALNVMVELESTKDWEAVFKNVHTMLRSEKWFIFDMYTIEGLVTLFNEGEQLLYDSPDLTVFTQNQYDYDRQMQTRRYVIFRRADGAWHKNEATRVLKTYPVQAVTALVQRSGFNILHVLNADLTRYEPNKTGVNRVIIMAQKR